MTARLFLLRIRLCVLQLRCILVVICLGLAMLFFYRPVRDVKDGANQFDLRLSHRNSTSGRKVFPWSVLPGGVIDEIDLKEKLLSDRVAAKHYGQLGSVIVVTELPSDQLFYASYRIGDAIFWTSHKVRVRTGERILRGKGIAIRGRCGNLLSDTPHKPTRTDEPSDIYVEAKIDLVATLTSVEVGHLLLDDYPSMAPITPLSPYDLPPLPLELPPPSFPTVELVPPVVEPIVPPVRPLVSSPEPGSGVLLASSLLLGLAILRALRRKTRADLQGPCRSAKRQG